MRFIVSITQISPLSHTQISVQPRGLFCVHITFFCVHFGFNRINGRLISFDLPASAIWRTRWFYCSPNIHLNISVCPNDASIIHDSIGRAVITFHPKFSSFSLDGIRRHTLRIPGSTRRYPAQNPSRFPASHGAESSPVLWHKPTACVHPSAVLPGTRSAANWKTKFPSI